MVNLSVSVAAESPQAIAEIRRVLAAAGYSCEVGRAETPSAAPVVSPLEMAGRHADDRWRTLIDRFPLACLLSDAEWRYTHWNAAAERTFGFRTDEILGKRPFETIVPEASEPLVRSIFDRLASGDMAAHGSCENRTRDGRTIYCSWHNTPLLDEAGNFLGLMSLAEDVTDRLLVEENRARLQHALEEANRELESVLYVTSHDLRSPLLNILGFSKELARCCQQLQEMLKSEFPDTLARRATRLALEQEIPEALHFIQASAQKMDGLLAGLLRLSRLGRQPLAMVDVNMNRLLAQVLETLKYQALVSRAEIELGDLPPCRGDAMQLNQLFTNLLENALKYLQPQRPGRIKLSGSVSSEAVIYCVEDNGMGIASEHQERVFELFHRLMPNRCAGEGLGLAIAHRIAARHRGKIWVESISEAGSSFFVSLPL